MKLTEQDLLRLEERLFYLQEKRIKSFDEIHEQVKLEEFLKRVKNAVKKVANNPVTRAVTGGLGKVAGLAAPIVNKIPGFGQIAGAALGAGSEMLKGHSQGLGVKDTMRNMAIGGVGGALPIGGSLLSGLKATKNNSGGGGNNNQQQDNNQQGNNSGVGNNNNMDQNQVDQMVMQWLQQNMG